MYMNVLILTYFNQLGGGPQRRRNSRAKTGEAGEDIVGWKPREILHVHSVQYGSCIDYLHI